MAISTYLTVICGGYFLFYISRICYRLYFHPLAQYPGSKLTICFPTCYKLYRNFRSQGRYIFEVEQLHQKYGSVVRISVNDLHVNDPEVYLEITRIGSRFRKDPKFYDRISFRNTSLGSLDPYKHGTTHTVLVNAAFSPRKFRELSCIVEQKVEKLMNRFELSATMREPVNIHKVSKALSMDIISQIAFGKAFDCLDHPHYRNIFLDRLHAIFEEMSWSGKILFTLAKVSLSTPPWIFKFIHPPTMILMKELAKPMVVEYMQKHDEHSIVGIGHPSAVIDALTNANLSKKDRSIGLESLCEEVVTLLTAGGDTVSTALIYGIYHICRNGDVYSKLVDELLSTFPSVQTITYEEAKNLPYLNAVIKEILCLSNPLPGRLPRVVPLEGFLLQDHKVLGGFVINTSAYLLNRHPSLWKDPWDFRPERWLSPDSKDLEKYMASFYRGTRQCLGKELAWSELYIMISNMFRRFEVTVHNTTDEDLAWIDAVLVVFQGKNFCAMLQKRHVRSAVIDGTPFDS